MADANVHNHRRCPLFLVGRGNGMLQGQRAPEGGRRHADGQRDADAAAQPRPAGPADASATAPASSRSRRRRRPRWRARNAGRRQKAEGGRIRHEPSRGTERRRVPCCMSALLGAAPTGSPVADAAMKGDLAAVKALLKEGADVNAARGDGMSALHWAAERGQRRDGERAASTPAPTSRPSPASGSTRRCTWPPARAAPRWSIALLEGGRARSTRRAVPSGATALHLAASAGSAGRHQPPDRRRRRQEREGSRVGADAAHLRRGVQPRRGHQGADRARRRPEHRHHVHRHPAAQRPRPRRQPAPAEGARVHGRRPRDASPPPARCRPPSRPRATLFLSGKIPPPEKEDDGGPGPRPELQPR